MNHSKISYVSINRFKDTDVIFQNDSFIIDDAIIIDLFKIA